MKQAIDEKKLEQLAQGLPHHFDLTDEKTQDIVENISAELIDLNPDLDALKQIQNYLIEHKSKFVPMFHLCVKNAISRQIILQLDQSVHISMNVAMYNEQNRMLKNTEHENGEDFINVKARQLNWLVRDTSHSWDLIFIDDGCPHQSGQIAEAIIQKYQIPHTRVLFLADAIQKGMDGAQGMQSAKDSVKGGSIQYGMFSAIQNIKKPNHLIAYTDADLSTDLRMCGLLVDKIINHNKAMAIGSRYLPGSLMDSTDEDGMTGERIQNFVKLRNEIRSNLLAELSKIRDTNCAFKMLTRTRAIQMLDQVREKTFAFDIEFLLFNVLLDETSIAPVSIVWADSNEEATSRHSKTHLEGIKGMCRIYLHYADQLSSADEKEKNQKIRLAQYFIQMDFDHYQKICDAMNPEFWEALKKQSSILPVDLIEEWIA